MKVVGIIAAMIVAVVSRGYVLSVLWEWFFVPPFGLPALGVAEAIGVSFLVAMLTYEHTGKQEPDWEKFIGMAVFYPWLCLLFAWPIRWFLT